MPKKKQPKEFEQLAEALMAGKQGAALSIVRSRLNDSFTHEFQKYVWEGWERALRRNEPDALIVDLLNGLPAKKAKEFHKDLKKKRSEILIRDHTKKALSNYYLESWVSLLDAYCSLSSSKK
ncbi:MAG: hypothetical protein GF308_15035 [Candidatus Heimdallarchaeota archaeon]|nr:hypothetical protein [Candidatus Heimdallarchaeota archaeon]